MATILFWSQCVNSLRPRRNGCYNADDIFNCIFLKENVWIPTITSLKFVPKGPINNIPALVQIMAWRCPGDKPVSEPMLIFVLMHICVTRPQWVNDGTLDNKHCLPDNLILLVISHWVPNYPLQWCHNEHHWIPNQQPCECLLNRLFRCRSKKTSRHRVTGLCAGNSPVNSPHKWPVTRKMFPFDDVIMPTQL